MPTSMVTPRAADHRPVLLPADWYSDGHPRLFQINRTIRTALSVYDAQGTGVAVVLRHQFDGDQNAARIAAVPQLIKALHRARNLLQIMPCGRAAVLQAEEALRAAGFTLRDPFTAVDGQGGAS